MTRKRVLFVGDSPAQSTGYARIFRELLPRLQDSHDVAVLGCFGEGGEAETAALSYKVYPAWPRPGDAEGRRRHDADPLMKWGRWYFEKTCLDYQPSVIALIRDVDHDEWIYRSPFRRHVRVLAMPTVDARPQKDEWVAACAQADALLSYTEFGGRVLAEQVGGLTPYLGVGTPGVDADLFAPVDDKAAHQRAAGLGGKFVVGTVMRSQDRKLFPELITAFARFVALAPPDVARRATLYLHTGHPDMAGWDLPKLLLEAGVAARTYFTYLCRACGAHYPSKWVGAVAGCRRCGRPAAQTANSDRGVPTAALAGVYNLFDVYCHLAYAGGLELPLLEAAACGVPVVTNDYASMGELGRALGADLVPNALVRQIGTNRLIAAPDTEAVARTLLAQSSQPPSVRRHRGYQQRGACRRGYTWERAAARWAAAISSLPPPERPWDAPRADWAGGVAPPPAGLSDAAFARHCLWALRANTSPGGLDELKLARDLAYGDRSAVWARVAAEAGVMAEWETERLRRFPCSSSATTRKPANGAKSPAAT